ncbi:hypothetical protein P153DRAFT_417449 [Dothidotthia symphoricarpi CBS 119687]|uniref:Uncharacterized protein n=1 Tax=Dothidotthia symphoricarpi CBS 119687 TaxID=1392245 RepID=A0A6A6AIV0_9PLEO|nr:uncharacterized protein P153DRAFT_417449 [Dothidotthia symphoricarpi CBS 119687]KAF2131153.1 hypothetical protein P153DRAFT_417449 [Dothidotthia symphoricarpi CBS 119687]
MTRARLLTYTACHDGLLCLDVQRRARFSSNECIGRRRCISPQFTTNPTDSTKQMIESKDSLESATVLPINIHLERSTRHPKSPTVNADIRSASPHKPHGVARGPIAEISSPGRGPHDGTRVFFEHVWCLLHGTPNVRDQQVGSAFRSTSRQVRNAGRESRPACRTEPGVGNAPVGRQSAKGHWMVCRLPILSAQSAAWRIV